MKLLSFLIGGLLAGSQLAFGQQHPITLVIHGGAGNITRERLTPEKQRAYEESLRLALREGYAVLEKGGSAVDAVEACLRLMEDDPLFNAGKGAVYTAEGRNELDAAIMDGATGKAGAVAGVTSVRNPISAARAVMEKSPHVLLTGPGADAFAKEQGLSMVGPDYFATDARREELMQAQAVDKGKGIPSATPVFIQRPASAPKTDAKKPAAPAKKPIAPPKKPALKTGKGPNGSSGLPVAPYTEGQKFGTVGAVALDVNGNLAAGTSTGGMTNKRPGRVGDSPIIGAGTYADNSTCAVSCTGHGEYFIRSVVAYDISALMAYRGMSVQEAANEVVERKLREKGGEGGVIALDRNGNYTMTFNSAGMFRGVVQHGKEPEVLIFK